MSFFEPPPPPPEPPEEHRQPAWIGPPENELGVAVPARHVLFRTDELVIALLGIVAFTNGVEMQIVMRRRHIPDEPDPMHAHMHARRTRGGSLAPEIFRFGVEYPDGRKATNIGHPPFDEEPTGPVLMQRGGGGGGRSWSFGYWLWPLPPPGPLRIVIEWPALNVPQTDLELDGATLVAAAADVDVLWPGDEPSSGGSVTSYIG